jgi:hypothetical protein
VPAAPRNVAFAVSARAARSNATVAVNIAGNVPKPKAAITSAPARTFAVVAASSSIE